jgi:hypothetical protein
MTSLSRTLVKMLLLLSGLLFFSVVHAEGNCPDGYYPLGTPGGGWQGCAPLPGNDPAYQHEPQQKWADQWGAIVTYEPGGVLGAAINMPTQEEAKRTAMADCQAKGGGSNCKLEITYYSQCVALVVGDKVYNTTSAATVEKASRSGMERCSEKSTNCHLYYSACSLPKQIQ